MAAARSGSLPTRTPTLRPGRISRHLLLPCSAWPESSPPPLPVRALLPNVLVPLRLPLHSFFLFSAPIRWALRWFPRSVEVVLQDCSPSFWRFAGVCTVVRRLGWFCWVVGLSLGFLLLLVRFSPESVSGILQAVPAGGFPCPRPIRLLRFLLLLSLNRTPWLPFVPNLSPSLCLCLSIIGMVRAAGVSRAAPTVRRPKAPRRKITRVSAFVGFVASGLPKRKWDGFFPVVSSEAASRNRKKRKVIHDRLKCRIPENFQDAVAISRVHGFPDIFSTFTCNPKWPEIMEALESEPGQRPHNRADMTVRVYHMKLTEYLRGIKDGKVFGPIVAVLHTIEFQKRGLPHAHILVWQDKEKRAEISPALIDSFVSAEIPDPAVDPLGYALVAEFMMHGPCGDNNPKCPCMKDNMCSKIFPKSFQAETSIDEFGFPVYRRRDDGRFVMKNKVRLDNRHVVPYNMELLKKYQAHLNVEWCNKTHVIKYLYKYVTKGPDFSKTLFERIKNDGDPDGEGIDEIEEYRICRYICAHDSFWRCYGYELHSKQPSVERLAVHLLNKHIVRFRAKASLPAIVNNSLLRKTMLTEWFIANIRHKTARSLAYCDFPTKWSWVAEKKRWVKRKKGKKIGRIYYVHPSTGELYYLRMLLMLVKGARSYADVRTYNNVVYGSFKDACAARGLLGDDNEWYCAFDEALEWGMGHQLHRLFVTMIIFCGVLDENGFFEKYWTYLAEDIQHGIRCSLNQPTYIVPGPELKNMLLDKLVVLFAKNGYSILDHGLPLKTGNDNSSCINDLISDELHEDCESLLRTAEAMQMQLNKDQRIAFNAIVDRVRNDKPGFFFVSGHGGTGKTFLWNALVAYLRGYKRIVLTVASSGVASLLLPGGRTAHSRFKIPINLDDDGVCDIRRSTMLSSLIESASLIIWDEALMTHRKCFEALDRSLRDVLSERDPLLANTTFGGKIVVLGGDLRQILPVIEGGTRAQVVNAAITNSPLWRGITVLRLEINMRLAVQTTDPIVQAEAEAFAQWILDVGDGKVPAISRQGESDPTWITVPEEHMVHTDGAKIPAIVGAVYTCFSEKYSNPNYLKERAILTPTNEIAEEINKHVLSLVPGEEREYLSCDSTGNSADGMAYNRLSEIHKDGNRWTICVLVSRMWHYRGGTDDGPIKHTDLVLLDCEGTHMYGQIPPVPAEKLKDVLQEGKVFVITKFLCTPSRPTFRPVESPFMVQFTRYTEVQEKPGLEDGFPFCTYSLTAFTDLPAPATRPARFVDVIGKISNVSDVIPIQSMYQTTASNTRTVMLTDLQGNDMKLVLWGDRAVEFDADAVRDMGAKEPVIAIFVGTLPKIHHGIKGLSGSTACRWYIDEDIPDINSFREGLRGRFVPLAVYDPTGPGALVSRVQEDPIDKTVSQLEELDPFEDMEKRFFCTVTIDRLGSDDRWWFPSCGACRKSAKHNGYHYFHYFFFISSLCFLCSVFRYCISVFATDGTAEAEFMLFDKVAAAAVGKTLYIILRQRYPAYTKMDDLANAARHDTFVPAEVTRLVGQKYKLMVSISKKWKLKNTEKLSFQVNRIEQTFKPALPPTVLDPAEGSSPGSGSRAPLLALDSCCCC
uniref:Uncharacterized protein n=1 Tax=Avena sativa TaxID=4498 RepID=A0ACD5XK49_AVESA